VTAGAPPVTSGGKNGSFSMMHSPLSHRIFMFQRPKIAIHPKKPVYVFRF